MTRHITLMAITVLVLVVAGGCRPRWTDSGIPKALDTDTLLRTAGSGMGITFGGGGNGAGRSPRAVETHHDFNVGITSGSPEQLLAAYRAEVRRQIETMGGKIHGTGTSSGDVQTFTYGYSWGSNEGIVRVSSFTATNGRIVISLFCYEHP